MRAHSVRRTPLCIFSLAFVTLVLGCSSEKDVNPVAVSGVSDNTSVATPAAGLDAQLDALLISRSGGEGRSFFAMPQSSQLELIPQDPQNPLTTVKVRLGQLLYHETALAVDNVRPEGFETYSCASCHHAYGGFMANLPQGVSEGGTGFGVNGEGREFDVAYGAPNFPDCQPIRTPTAMNAAYQELMLWNGQFGGVGDNIGTEAKWLPGTPLDSNNFGMQGLETQAHAGLVVHRMGDIELSRVATIPEYRALFTAAFGKDSINRLNAALAIAAYERTLLSNQAPFQKWLRGNKNAMTAAEKRGAILFFGEANCVSCHTGPALNSMTFHALGMNDLDHSCDPGRVFLTPFGGTISVDVRQGRGGFTGRSEDMYAFKTPQLYNLKSSPFLGHGASFEGVRAVIEYKNAAVPENPMVDPAAISPEFVPLGLTPHEINDLVAFVEDALYDGELLRYQPNRLPSGNCFPANDPLARIDLGCEREVAVDFTSE